MVNRLLLITILGFALANPLESLAQIQKLGLKTMTEEQKSAPTCFAIPNTPANKSYLNSSSMLVKYSTSEWIFVTASPSDVLKATKDGLLTDFYLQNGLPQALADTARATHFVNDVHNGTGGLMESYSGKGVIIGYVDQGIDFTHPDFKNADGSTRVLRYWDHTTNSGGPASPYGYGIVWDSTAINNGTCTSTETGTAHGTTVAGQGSANGLANGKNAGMAPESNIIIVESNFNLSNWDLSIADACDYIFKVADSLGMPAVVNLSLGNYLGSHDGNDPATEAIESLLDEHGGRIVVCAAGNSGNQGKYHVQGNMVNPTDTNFVWILNNPSASAAFGANHIYFDVWSDLSNDNYQFAFGADRPAPNYGLRGATDFWNTSTQLGGVILDTIYNSLGNRIATIEAYPQVVGSSYHLEVYFSNVDSTSYQFRFMTKGTGKYDAWSGAWLGLNNWVTTIPSTGTYPPIATYQMPDSLQTIVSGWAASEKIITVGNVKNRWGHMTANNTYYTGNSTPVGKLSINSSKGPSRLNVQKPDVTASGDGSLTAAPLWLLTNPAYWGAVDQGGWHARNGGTSMASPVVAGIAALYLEKCPIASYASFKNDLTATAFTDGFTGPVPNYAYGYGKANALDLMLTTQFSASIVGPVTKCEPEVPLLLVSDTTISSQIWNTSSTANPLMVSAGGDYYATVYNGRGCRFYTDTHNVEQLQYLSILPIELNGSILSTPSTLPNYQWTLNGVDVQDSINQTMVVEAPYGSYTCYTVSVDGCVSETPPYQINVGLEEESILTLSIYPNPSTDEVNVEAELAVERIHFYDESGRKLKVRMIGKNKYDVSQLSSGTYFIVVESNGQKMSAKFVK